MASNPIEYLMHQVCEIIDLTLDDEDAPQPKRLRHVAASPQQYVHGSSELRARFMASDLPTITQPDPFWPGYLGTTRKASSVLNPAQTTAGQHLSTACSATTFCCSSQTDAICTRSFKPIAAF
ncbi:hypothetical protein DOTSEDRAFT_21181 [Dothistroma septosporum NZE10]|uniref:Uncharacterized protein n=1 Tax=Dothistroma septosporum (strain NZE10 / CBS 128990) TaxID=675120 RepID=N1PYS0_DOTSN|nr:hypothetical protein DOTSEDRAFT_21181 [Dothistroma septosporum NZE10]